MTPRPKCPNPRPCERGQPDNCTGYQALHLYHPPDRKGRSRGDGTTGFAGYESLSKQAPGVGTMMGLI